MKLRELSGLVGLSGIAALATAIAMLGLVVDSPKAEAGIASNLTTLGIGGDSFYNYDFQSQSAVYNNVDWPMTIVFWNNASVNNVKSVLSSTYPFSGGPMYARLNDGGGWVWDNDSGRKGEICPITDTPHIRIYADSDDRLYNTSWGYWVIASTHFDFFECGWDPEYGWTEEAEGLFVDYFASQGYSVVHDWSSFSNYEPPHWQGNHFYDNNGMHSIVLMP